MARPLRLEYPGAIYHVTARGNERRAIFRSDTDRRRFVRKLSELRELHGLDVYAFMLMTNHVLCGAPHRTCYAQLPVM
jgi:putative transposase